MRPIDKDRLARRRKDVGYTQYELAMLCKCSQAAISGLETGNMKNCSLELAKTIAKWLDREPEELFETFGAERVSRMTNALGSKHQKIAA